jgi:hypothetical protein
MAQPASSAECVVHIGKLRTIGGPTPHAADSALAMGAALRLSGSRYADWVTSQNHLARINHDHQP